MARTLTVDIVTPERVVLSDETTSLVGPGVLGSFGVLHDHAPMLAELGIGELRYRKDSGEEIRLAIGRGFLQVFHNQITVLADSAERSDEIDIDRARAALNQARENLREAQGGYEREELCAARDALDRAQNRLRVAGVR